MSVAGMVAQDVTQVDSIADQELSEVVIEAPKVIRKSDMDVYHPSKSAVENSANGMQLLRNLMIPSLTVNDALGTVMSGGQSVQVRINGREATIDQVRNLLPGTVKRVEWMDNPGLRYNGATHVLNFIVTNPTAGGSLMYSGLQSVNDRFGQDHLDVKLNSGHSQWNIGGFFKLTDNIRSHRDYKETFTYTDGTSLTRTERPLGGAVNDTRANAWMSYNYLKPDTTVLYVSIQGRRNFKAEERYEGLLSLSDGSNDIRLDEGNGSRGTTPSFSTYLEQHFSHRQTLVVDLGVSLYNGRSFSDYQESLPDVSGYLTDVHTLIRDRNQAYAAEADYIKEWDQSRFTAGGSYNGSRNRSTYENLGGTVYHQRQDKVYLFAEYFRRIRNFTLTAGMGVQYTDFMFRETEQGNNSWNLRPRATVTYSLNPNHRFNLSFTTWQSSPSLAETNIAPQQLDGFQWRIGNPDLKTSNSYMLYLRYGFSLPRVEGTFGVRAFTSPDAITPYLYWEGDRLITSYENSRGLRNLAFSFSPQIEIVPGWIMASGNVTYRVERMRGQNYKLYNHNWCGSVQLMVMHNGFTLTGQYMKAQRNLFGEKIDWGEDMSIVDLSYQRGRCRMGAGMLMPFGKYDQGSKLLSRYNTNEKHMRVDLKVFYLALTYNLEWGRQKRGVNKLVNADANVETSKTGGR